MPRLVLFFFLLLSSSLFGQLDSSQSIALQVFKLRLQIDAAVEKGKYMQALSHWVDVLELEPDNPEHYFQRSRLFQKMGDYPAALSDCHILVRLEPENYRSYWRRAELYFIQRKFPQTLADLDRAIDYSDSPLVRYSILFDRGLCKEQSLDFRGATDDYLAIITEYNDHHTKALQHLGISYNKLNMPDSSIFYLKTAILQTPDHLASYLSLSYTYTDLGRYDEALPLLNHALYLNENQPDSYYQALCLNNRGYCYLKTGNEQQARRDLWLARRLLPFHPYIYRNCAAWFVIKKKRGAACRNWKKAQDLGYEEQYGSDVREQMEQFCRH